MEIKEGMYVRTKEGYIAKLKHYGKNDCIEGNSYLFDKPIRNIEQYVFSENDFLWDNEIKKYITKASYNIIDLIEEGDYVNGFKVTKTGKTFPITNAKIIDCKYEMAGNVLCWTYSNKDIKSVVTKEQFKNMEYEVK